MIFCDLCHSVLLTCWDYVESAMTGGNGEGGVVLHVGVISEENLRLKIVGMEGSECL